MPQYEGIRVSNEFINLCEAQLSLLFHDFVVQETAIYLTDNYHQEPKLIPIIVYPDSSRTSENNLLPSFSQTLINEGVIDVLDNTLEEQIFSEQEINSDASNQLVLPLMYEDIVFGLLATTRKNQSWQSHEILKIKEMAQTLAIARLLEQKQQVLETKYNNLQELQDLKNEHLDDFLHQLKNPLTAIRTFAKLLLRTILPDDPSHHTSQSIIRESDRLQDLITDFNQQWQRPHSNTVTLAGNQSTSFFLTEHIELLTKFDIIEVLIPIIETIEIIAAEKNIQIYRNLNNSLPLVISNQKALTEIINNLLENAVKYTPEKGSILIEIDINKNNLIQIKIFDTGYGIPLEDQAHIFERHYRGFQEAIQIKGSGLGLAIVKELCDKINLNITMISPYFWLQNQQYNGTQFCLTFMEK